MRKILSRKLASSTSYDPGSRFVASLIHGNFVCSECHVYGADVLDFQMQYYSQGVEDAAAELGVWT